MAFLAESVKSWCQIGKRWCLGLAYYVCENFNTSRSHWAAGLMFGLSGAASVFLGSSDIPRTLSYGVIIGFIASVAKYIWDYLLEIVRYGGRTALTLLTITVLLFHGLTSWTTIFTWLPIFISISLLTTVNVSPGVAEQFNALYQLLFALRERGRSVERTRYQDMDVEQAQHLSGMVERQGSDFERHRSIGSNQSYMRPHLEPRDHGSPEGTDASIELPGSVSTTPEIRLIMRNLEPDYDSGPQYIATAPIGHMEDHRLYFPEIPQDAFLEPITRGNTLSPRIEEPPSEL